MVCRPKIKNDINHEEKIYNIVHIVYKLELLQALSILKGELKGQVDAVINSTKHDNVVPLLAIRVRLFEDPLLPQVHQLILLVFELPYSRRVLRHGLEFLHSEVGHGRGVHLEVGIISHVVMVFPIDCFLYFLQTCVESRRLHLNFLLLFKNGLRCVLVLHLYTFHDVVVYIRFIFRILLAFLTLTSLVLRLVLGSAALALLSSLIITFRIE